MRSGNETAEHARRALEAAAECKRHLSAKECARRAQVAKAVRRLRDACGIEGASFSDLDLVLDYVEPLVTEQSNG